MGAEALAIGAIAASVIGTATSVASNMHTANKQKKAARSAANEAAQVANSAIARSTDSTAAKQTNTDAAARENTHALILLTAKLAPLSRITLGVSHLGGQIHDVI